MDDDFIDEGEIDFGNLDGGGMSDEEKKLIMGKLESL